MIAVVPSWSCSSMEIVTSACASLVRLMSSIAADRLPGHQDLVARDELPAVLEQQVVGVPARPSEQDHEHEDEADQQSPAAGNSGDPRAAPGTRRLPFRRHRSGAACPLLMRNQGVRLCPAGIILSFPHPPSASGARSLLDGILFLAPLRGGDQT